MTDLGHNNNVVRNQKHFKSIANGDVADSDMISLTEQISISKPKKE